MGDLYNFSVSVGGVIYWTDYDFQVDGTVYFLAVDAEDETILEVPIPSVSQEPYTNMGDYLSGFVTSLHSLTFEICVLKDWPRGEWTKVYMIDMEKSSVPWDLNVYLPIGWLNADEVLIMEGLTSRGDIYLAYDVKRNEANIVDLSVCGSNFYAHTNTNSLVSWQTIR